MQHWKIMIRVIQTPNKLSEVSVCVCLCVYIKVSLEGYPRNCWERLSGEEGLYTLCTVCIFFFYQIHLNLFKMVVRFLTKDIEEFAYKLCKEKSISAITFTKLLSCSESAQTLQPLPFYSRTPLHHVCHHCPIPHLWQTLLIDPRTHHHWAQTQIENPSQHTQPSTYYVFVSLVGKEKVFTSLSSREHFTEVITWCGLFQTL